MHGCWRPGLKNTMSVCPNRRLLRRPLKMLTRTRAGWRLATLTSTHLERRSERSEILPGATSVVGPLVRVWGLGIVFFRFGTGVVGTGGVAEEPQPTNV